MLTNGINGNNNPKLSLNKKKNLKKKRESHQIISGKTFISVIHITEQYLDYMINFKILGIIFFALPYHTKIILFLVL